MRNIHAIPREPIALIKNGQFPLHTLHAGLLLALNLHQAAARTTCTSAAHGGHICSRRLLGSLARREATDVHPPCPGFCRLALGVALPLETARDEHAQEKHFHASASVVADAEAAATAT